MRCRSSRTSEFEEVADGEDPPEGRRPERTARIAALCLCAVLLIAGGVALGAWLGGRGTEFGYHPAPPPLGGDGQYRYGEHWHDGHRQLRSRFGGDGAHPAGPGRPGRPGPRVTPAVPERERAASRRPAPPGAREPAIRVPAPPPAPEPASAVPGLRPLRRLRPGRVRSRRGRVRRRAAGPQAQARRPRVAPRASGGSGGVRRQRDRGRNRHDTGKYRNRVGIALGWLHGDVHSLNEGTCSVSPSGASREVPAAPP